MRRARLRVWFLASLVAGAFAFWWFRTPPPNVGGGQSDDALAPWVKNRVYASVSPRDEQGFVRLTSENSNGWYSIAREPIQSLDYYRSLQPTRPTSRRRVIVLQPIGAFDATQKALLIDLKEFCAAFFQLPVRIAPPLPLPTSGVQTRKKAGKIRSESDRQFEAANLLQTVLAPRLPNDAAAYLGITMTDLWTGDLSFVFGLGNSQGRIGVYSLARYFPDAVRDMTEGERQIGLRRSCQVLDHEMGHMLGLYHCVLYKCAMNGVNSLADADATPLDYCPVCHRKLLWNTGATGTKRYGELLAFYRKHALKSEADWTAKRLVNWRASGALKE